jgi:hypothetical protein
VGTACAGSPEKGYTNNVIVQIDGKPITEFDITLYMRHADPEYFKLKEIIENADRLEAIQEARQFKALQELAQLRTLVAYAEHLDLKIPEKHHRAMQKKFEEEQIRKFGSAEKYRAHLTGLGLTLEQVFRFELDSELVRQLRLREYRRMPVPTEEQTRVSYELNRELFQFPPRYTAFHFCVMKEKTETGAVIAKKIASTVFAAIRAGKPFEKVAGNASASEKTVSFHSMDWEKGNSSLLKTVAEAAEKLKPGETTDIIETSEAFHIVKLEKIEEGRLQTYEEVSERIKEAHLARNWRRAKIAIMQKALDTVFFDPDYFTVRDETAISWKEFLSSDIFFRGPAEKE